MLCLVVLTIFHIKLLIKKLPSSKLLACRVEKMSFNCILNLAALFFGVFLHLFPFRFWQTNKRRTQPNFWTCTSVSKSMVMFIVHE